MRWLIDINSAAGAITFSTLPLSRAGWESCFRALTVITDVQGGVRPLYVGPPHADERGYKYMPRSIKAQLGNSMSLAEGKFDMVTWFEFVN